MPGPIDGLKRARTPQEPQTPDAQALALMERNRLLSGQPEAPMTPSPAQAGGFTFSNPDMPDIAGLVNAMRGAGIQGQRMTDIELPPQQQGLDELTRRIDALLSSQR